MQGGKTIDGRNILGGAGFVSGPAGDLNADGYPDFVFSENGVQEGASGYVYVIYSPYGGVSFVRSDANFDGEVNISDAIFALSYLFLGGAVPLCHDATDADDSGRVEITDAIRILGSLFVGDVTLPEPFPGPVADATADELGCQGF